MDFRTIVDIPKPDFEIAPCESLLFVGSCFADAIGQRFLEEKFRAIVMGTESTGLTDVWRQAADAHIRIPMLGQLDSLNVSVSAAILLFEAVRQRQSVKPE